MAAQLLLKSCPEGCDPLGPDNPIVFAVGPLTGLFPLASKTVAMFKSPHTGNLGESHCGGRSAVAIRMAGYGAIVIEGKSETPVYLAIHGSRGALPGRLHPVGHEQQPHRRAGHQGKGVGAGPAYDHAYRACRREDGDLCMRRPLKPTGTSAGSVWALCSAARTSRPSSFPANGPCRWPTTRPTASVYEDIYAGGHLLGDHEEIPRSRHRRRTSCR